MYLIDVHRVADEAGHVDFEFSAPEGESPGLLRLNKATGETTLVRPIARGRIGAADAGPLRHASRYFDRAARRVYAAWRDGTIEDHMTWAS